MSAVRFPRIVLATGNAHKVQELRAILEPLLPGVELVPYDGPSPVEDGDSFTANALIKARAAEEFTGLPALADDSGIEVAALDGAPGIRSARFAGTGVDADNRRLLLERMSGVADRRARFTCAAVLVFRDDRLTAFSTWPGIVLDEARGSGGFGYDPIFRPDGHDVSAAELTTQQKNAESHRGTAFSTLAAAITGS